MKRTLYYFRQIRNALLLLMTATLLWGGCRQEAQETTPVLSTEEQLRKDPMLLNYINAYLQLHYPALSQIRQHYHNSQGSGSVYYATLQRLLSQPRTPENLDQLTRHLGFPHKDSLEAAFHEFTTFSRQLEKNYPELARMPGAEKKQLFQKAGDIAAFQKLATTILESQPVIYIEERGRSEAGCLEDCYATFTGCYGLGQSVTLLEKAFCGRSTETTASYECMAPALAEMILSAAGCTNDLYRCRQQCNPQSRDDLPGGG